MTYIEKIQLDNWFSRCRSISFPTLNEFTGINFQSPEIIKKP